MKRKLTLTSSLWIHFQMYENKTYHNFINSREKNFTLRCTSYVIYFWCQPHPILYTRRIKEMFPSNTQRTNDQLTLNHFPLLNIFLFYQNKLNALSTDISLHQVTILSSSHQISIMLFPLKIKNRIQSFSFDTTINFNCSCFLSVFSSKILLHKRLILFEMRLTKVLLMKQNMTWFLHLFLFVFCLVWN
jgi:hypothetical protein